MVKSLAFIITPLCALLLPYCPAAMGARLAPNIIVIGHRGVQNEAPRNTLASLRRAIELGLDYAEIDVRTTADGKLIDMHNETVDGATNGSGLIVATTYAEIAQLDAGSSFSPKFKGEKVPLFAEELALAKGRIKFYLDLKACDGVQVGLLIEQFGMVDDVVCFPNAPGQAEALLSVNPRFKIMPHLARVEDMPGYVEKYHVKVVEYSSGPMKPEILEAAHRHGAQVFMDIQGWGDNEKNILECLHMGVDAIQTDNAQLVLDVLKRAGVRRLAPRKLPALAPTRGQRADGDKVKIIGCGGVAKSASADALAGVRAAIAQGLDYVSVSVHMTASGLRGANADHNAPTEASPAPNTPDDWKFNIDPGMVLRVDPSIDPDILSPLVPKTPPSGPQDETAPLLGEVLALAHGRIGVYLDIESADPRVLVHLLQEFAMTREVLVHGDEMLLRTIRTLDASIPQAPRAADLQAVRSTARKLAPEVMDISGPTVTDEAVALCTEARIEPMTTLMGGSREVAAQARKAVAAGVRIIRTDQPAAVMRALR